MKKVIICNIPMREHIADIIFSSNDASLPVSGKPFRYLVNSFLSQTVKEDDELKFILLIKKDGNPFYEKNAEYFRQEAGSIIEESRIKAEFVMLDTAFSQKKETHEKLMADLIDEIDTGSHVIADITYGPKDLPVVIFSALSFAEKFLRCEIDNIIYGKAEFEGDEIVRSEISDMIPLYCLSSLTNTIKCDDPERARQILKSLLSL